MSELVEQEDVVRGLKRPETGAGGDGRGPSAACFAPSRFRRTRRSSPCFEPHTDIIVKDRRDTYYGHKVFVTAGASVLVLDCAVEAGSPADATMALPMLKRQNALYGRPPVQAAMDGGFASKQNLRDAKELGVENVCFQKKRGLKVSEMRGAPGSTSDSVTSTRRSRG